MISTVIYRTPRTRKTVDVKSYIAANSPQALREIAIAGGDIAMTPGFIVEDAINDGRLISILSEYTHWSSDYTLFTRIENMLLKK
jgi:DNA-binding transcriptional LysR family regulator